MAPSPPVERSRSAEGGTMTGATYVAARKATEIIAPLRYVAGLIREIPIAFRSLVRTPGFSATVALTLALGIGVNAAIRNVVQGVILRQRRNGDETSESNNRQS